MTIVVNREDLNTIVSALQDATEHLEYCGYGDAWERQCAEKLVKKLETANNLGELMIGKS